MLSVYPFGSYTKCVGTHFHPDPLYPYPAPTVLGGLALGALGPVPGGRAQGEQRKRDDDIAHPTGPVYLDTGRSENGLLYTFIKTFNMYSPESYELAYVV